MRNGWIIRTGKCQALVENWEECGAICGVQFQDFGEFCDHHEKLRFRDYCIYKQHDIDRFRFAPQTEPKIYALSYAQELQERIIYQRDYNCEYCYGHRVRNELCSVGANPFY